MKALAFSGGKDSMACLHLLRDELDVLIYVDTGYSYPETQRMIDYADNMVPLHIVRPNRAMQNDREGIPSDLVPVNWTRAGQIVTGAKPVRVQDYLSCCYANISAPLMAAAKRLGVKTLYSGQRADESHRSPAKSGDIVDGIRRVHPIDDWSAARVLLYLAENMDVPEHFSIKHSSLDCYDCTAYAEHSADRVEWTRRKYPDFYEAYRVRENARRAAIMQSVRA